MATWTQDEINKMVQLRGPRVRAKWECIAKTIGKSEQECMAKWEEIRPPRSVRVEQRATWTYQEADGDETRRHGDCCPDSWKGRVSVPGYVECCFSYELRYSPTLHTFTRFHVNTRSCPVFSHKSTPKLKMSDWTKEEDEKLLALKGPKSRAKWESIAKTLGRTEEDCKARWNEIRPTPAAKPPKNRASSSSSAAAASSFEVFSIGEDGDGDDDEEPHPGYMRPMEAIVKHGFSLAFSSFSDIRKRARDALEVAEDVARSHEKRYAVTEDDDEAVIASRRIAKEWALVVQLTDGYPDDDDGGEGGGGTVASA
jgi:hypothetical protein